MSARGIAAVALQLVVGLFWTAVELAAVNVVFAAMRVRRAAGRRSSAHALGLYMRSGMHAGSAIRRAGLDRARADDSFQRAVCAHLAADEAVSRALASEMEVERWT